MSQVLVDSDSTSKFSVDFQLLLWLENWTSEIILDKVPIIIRVQQQVLPLFCVQNLEEGERKKNLDLYPPRLLHINKGVVVAPVIRIFIQRNDAWKWDDIMMSQPAKRGSQVRQLNFK